MNNLKTLGWDNFFESHFQPYAANGYAAGRVASEQKHFYSVHSESGKVLGEIAGRLRHEALDRSDLPTLKRLRAAVTSAIVVITTNRGVRYGKRWLTARLILQGTRAMRSYRGSCRISLASRT